MTMTAAPRIAMFLATCLGACLSAGPLAAAPALPPESLREFTWVGDPEISPDGRRTAFVKTTVDAKRDDYDSDLWLIDGDRAPRALTTSGDAGTPRWSPDGTRHAFVSMRSGKRQVYVLELAGGEPWQLTDDAEGVATFSWSPDGKRVAFLSRSLLPEEAAKAPAERPPGHSRPAFVTERLSTRSDGRPGWLPGHRAHIWVVATDAGPSAKASRVTDGDYDDGAPDWSRDGSTLYFSAVRKPEGDRAMTDTEIYAVAAAGGSAPRALTSREGPDDGPRVSPDGRWIAYTGFDESHPAQSYNGTHLYVLNVASGEVRRLAQGLDRSIDDGVIGDMGSPRGEGGGLVWRADSGAVYFVSADRGVADLIEATLDGRYRALTHLSDGDVRAFDVDKAGRVVAVHASTTRPAELFAFPLKDAARVAAWRPLTAFNAEIATRAAFVPYEEFWFKGSAPLVTLLDGHSPGSRQWIQSWILKPPGFDPARRYPLVLYIHGGPHAMYGTTFFHEMQVLAHAGYVVLMCNPRGSTGYGEKFADVIHNHYPGDDYTDLMDGMDALLERGYVDPARLFVAGGSGGGLLSAWIVGHTTRFSAALVERAVINWYSFVGAADMNYWFTTRWFHDTPWHESADYLARSPISYVDAVETPVLVLHNQDDYRVPLDQGLQFYTALKELGKPARLAVFPDSSHGMSRDGRPDQRIERLNLILDWFAQHGGAAR